MAVAVFGLKSDILIIVKLQGGLGNQMFQFAAGLALAAHQKAQLKLDTSFLLDRTPRENFVYRDFDLDIFGLDAHDTYKIKNGSCSVSHQLLFDWLPSWRRSKNTQPVQHLEKSLDFDPSVFDLKGSIYLDGYFLSFKYFSAITGIVSEVFQVRTPLTIEENGLMQEIRQQEAVCVHVRRTDFVANDFHGTCSMSYYLSSMQQLREELSQPRFYLFSDDPDWCSQAFGAIKDVCVVSHAYKDMMLGSCFQLMCACRHFVISNSTFSWWAAWLGTYPAKKTMAPHIWLQGTGWEANDLIPKTWIRRHPFSGELMTHTTSSIGN